LQNKDKNHIISPPPSLRGEGFTYISAWLFATAALVFLMVVLGGLTRLSQSGLSIVKWQPLIGAIPPLNADDWQKLFQLYQDSPQYRKVNYGMSLAEFKNIFWLEYIHRLLGRIIGLVFFIPLVFFTFTGKINRKLAVWLFFIFLLGAVQGLAGWYMVKSGLVDNPAVSHYRLALHLFLAFVIYALLFLAGLNCHPGAGRDPGHVARHMANAVTPAVNHKPVLLPLRGLDPGLRRDDVVLSFIITALILFQVILGAFVSGTGAGLLYNTFPLMNGQIIPEDIFFLKPFWLNFLENRTTIQFQHRLGAFILFFLIFTFWYKTHQSEINKAANLLLITAILQIGLGILTLLNQVPLLLASLHQTGALVLFSVSLFINHRLYAISRA